MENLNIKPIQAENRIFILDALRGFALLGILLINIPYFGKSYHLNYNLEILGEYTGANYWSWWVVNGLFEGTMRAIFSMLFGAGAILLLDRIEKKPLEGITAADFYYRRLIWLLLFGMVNAYIFLWVGDILYTYAICGLFLYPFRKLKAGSLLFFASIFLSLSILQSTSKMNEPGIKKNKAEAALQLEKQHRKLTETQKDDLKEWKTFQDEHSIAHYKSEIKRSNKTMRSGYPQIFEEISEVNTRIQTKYFYFELFFDALAFFFLGMGLYRLRFLTGDRSLQEYAAVAFFTYGLGLPLSYWINRTALNDHFDPSLTWQTFTINLYQIKRVLLSLGHISLFLLVFKLRIANYILYLLSNVGRMAFSNYLMQSIICTLIFNGYGLGLYGYLERYQLYEIVLAVWVFQIGFSWLWLKYFLYGPFEWLWRSLTYWKIQEFYKGRIGVNG